MRVLVLLSGGIDSTTLLWQLKSQDHDVLAMAVDYGQRHRVELQAARRVARERLVPFQLVSLHGVFAGAKGSSQVDGDTEVPHGHYEAESMKKTVVPNRNMILLAVATSQALIHNLDAVAYAAHAGDHAIYHDCRPDFVDAMREVISFCDGAAPRLMTPFIDDTKAEIVRIGSQLGVPFELTWSCYEGGAAHCGRCGTCVERREAFELAGIEDPTTWKVQIRREPDSVGTRP